MEELEYLIRTLTYKRSQLELGLKMFKDNELALALLKGKIWGIQSALNEIYKLVGEKAREN